MPLTHPPPSSHPPISPCHPPRPHCTLQPGAELTGRVTKITPYGAFVDLGSHGSGLVHISQISDSFVSSVSSHLSINDLVRVRVLSVDPATNRIALSIKESRAGRARGYERVVQLGGDWGHPWNDDGEARFVDMGSREKGPEAWEVDPTLFEEWKENDDKRRSE